MIKNWYCLCIAVIIWLICMWLTMPFPNALNTEQGVTVLNVLIKTNDGYQIEGLVTILLLSISLYYFVYAVKKYQILLFFVIIVSFVYMPILIVNAYQNTLATGIHAVFYDIDKSECKFKLEDDYTLKGVCRLPLQNLSTEEVKFNLGFYETYWYENDVRSVSLMNEGLPYEVRLTGKQKKWVKVETLIDVSQIENHIEKGTVSGVHIVIIGGGQIRKL
ncbi:hypothetical protein ACIQZG_23330 [Lysinibacillus sp. NPDC096418]|uniref:hypothetical protein n=1 Tax=Lysinibacillus sp. NPDC096418 TaxID=3364138 RepID=UPI0037F9546B